MADAASFRDGFANRATAVRPSERTSPATQPTRSKSAQRRPMPPTRASGRRSMPMPARGLEKPDRTPIGRRQSPRPRATGNRTTAPGRSQRLSTRQSPSRRLTIAAPIAIARRSTKARVRPLAASEKKEARLKTTPQRRGRPDSPPHPVGPTESCRPTRANRPTPFGGASGRHCSIGPRNAGGKRWGRSLAGTRASPGASRNRANSDDSEKNGPDYGDSGLRRQCGLIDNGNLRR